MSSYNWTKANTKEGRERLKELLNGGMDVITKDSDGCINFAVKHNDGNVFWVGKNCVHIDEPYMTLYFTEFLDPKPKEAKDGN